MRQVRVRIIRNKRKFDPSYKTKPQLQHRLTGLRGDSLVTKQKRERKKGKTQAKVLSKHQNDGGGKKRNKTRNKTKNRRRTNNKKKRKTKNKFSLKNAKKRIISKEKYKELIQKRQHNKKLSLNERKKLDHALFINYCSCVKSLKYDSKVKDYLEYPVCMSSIYKKRGFNPPKGVTVRCKKYK